MVRGYIVLADYIEKSDCFRIASFMHPCPNMILEDLVMVGSSMIGEDLVMEVMVGSSMILEDLAVEVW